MKSLFFVVIKNKFAAFSEKGVLINIILAMGSFMLIPWLSFIYRPYFAYHNGSDEQLYLTYQGGLALQDDRIRWLSSHLVLLAHEVGISGAVFNLLFDLIAPLLMFAVVVTMLKNVWSIREPWMGAWIIVFGSCLFNQSNPMLEGLLPDFRYSQTMWVSAFEGFAPYIRTPEPQLSLLAALSAWFLAWKSKWWVILLLPLPFMYDNVLLPYGFLVTVFLGLRLTNLSGSLNRELLLNCGVFFALSLAIYVVDAVGFFENISHIPTHYRHSHQPVLSIGLLITIFSLAFIWRQQHQFGSTWSGWDSAALAMVFLQIFISNQSVVSGVSIFPQALQSVGGTFGSSFLLFYLYDFLPENWRVKRTIALAVSLLVLWSINNSQGLQLFHNKYRVRLYHNITKEDLSIFKSAPLSFIGASQFYKGYIALAYPKQLMPLMAHSYNFPFFMQSCEKLAELNIDAVRFVENNISDPVLNSYRKDLLAESEAIRDSVNQVKAYKNRCPDNIPEKVDFRIFPQADDLFVEMRLFPPRLVRQGVDF